MRNPKPESPKDYAIILGALISEIKRTRTHFTGMDKNRKANEQRD